MFFSILQLAAFYGLRHSEVIGLKWDAIDFENSTICIRHTVNQYTVDGKTILVTKDRTKNKSNYRTLPLVPEMIDVLARVKQEQERNREFFGKGYNKNAKGYICIDKMGNLIEPTFITQHFPILLKNSRLRRIRFHDLRHSCASLLLANGISMKEIQEWLGHSNFSTTANIYAHLEAASKQVSAKALSGVFGFSDETHEIKGIS
jgi:integrase